MSGLKWILGMMVVLSFVAGWGCSKAKPQKEEAPASAPGDEARMEKARAAFEQAMMQCDALYQENKGEEALALLTAALANPELADFKAEIFQRLMFAEIMAERVTSAQERYLAMRRENPALARQCFGMIEGHLFERKEFDALSAWIDTQMKDEADASALVALAQWQFRVARAQEKADAAVAVLTPLAGRLDAARWRGLAGEFCSTLIQEGAASEAEAVIEFLAGKEAADPEIAVLRNSLRLSLWVSRQEWAPAIAFVKELSVKTADAALNGYFSQVADPLRRARQNEILTDFCKWAIYDLQGKPAVRESAAQMYVRNGVETEQVTLTLDRIGELKKAGFDAAHVGRWMDWAYSISMKKGTTEDFKVILSLGSECLPGLKEPREQANMAGILLDVSFRLDQFKTAQAILEKGVAGQDAAWHKSMLNKVKAHIDLQEGRPLDAAQKFIVFLNESAAKMEPTIDPITGDLITREMVQGLNAKRIADLMKQGGNAAEATAYYLKAREFYTAALKGVDPNSARADKIKAELDAIPQS